MIILKRYGNYIPVKRQRTVSDAKKKELHKVGYKTLEKCIDRYIAELEKDKDWRKPQNGSTFFNSGYIDYLDENYVPGKQVASNNKFNDFPQRERTKEDYAELEKKLLNKGR